MRPRVWIPLAVLGVSGCASFGPTSVDRDRFDCVQAIIQRGRPLLAAAAALAMAFGASLLGWRPPDLLTAVWRLAVYALLLGALRLVATLWLRGPDHAHSENLPTRRVQA